LPDDDRNCEDLIQDTQSLQRDSNLGYSLYKKNVKDVQYSMHSDTEGYEF